MSPHDSVNHAEVSLERSSLALTVFAAVACSLPSAAASHAHHGAAKAHPVASHAVSRHAASSRATSSHYVSTHAPQGRYAQRVSAVHHEAPPAMDPARATAIQTALIRAGYLSGEPSGVWDTDSISAMQKLQDANGWQTKYTPDSRALVKLGLGGASLSATAPTGTPVALEAAPAPIIAQP